VSKQFEEDKKHKPRVRVKHSVTADINGEQHNIYIFIMII